MGTIKARKESLFTIAKDPHQIPDLKIGKCRCGHLFFPPHRLGCEACGAFPDAIEIVEIKARGKLCAVSQVHIQPRPDGTFPLFVGKIAIDDGPQMMASLDIKDPAEVLIGQKMIGKLVMNTTDDQGNTIADLYFAVEEVDR